MNTSKYKGYRERIANFKPPPKSPPGNPIYPQVVRCSKCKKNNSVEISPEIKNISNCYFCGNPYYIIKIDQ